MMAVLLLHHQEEEKGEKHMAVLAVFVDVEVDLDRVR